jgi:ApaG protein
VAAPLAEPSAADRLPDSRRIVHHVDMFMSDATTRGVHIQVRSEYSADRSRPAEQQWFFLYTITISNRGEESVQLLSRHWVITDGEGHVEEVRGPGVVGQQPIIAPGDAFTYTSGCPLQTSFGMMEGTYQMTTTSGESFEAKIAAFTLSEPYTVH